MNPTTQTSSLTELLSHSDWLRVLARKLVADEASADDLVQETWLAAMKNPPASDRSPRPWLAGVVRNLAKLRFRSETRRSRRQGEVAAKLGDLPSAAELVEQVETERQLAAVVLTLDEPFRTAVLLRYFQDRSLADIAASQGVPAATVRWRHARGLELLRDGLQKKYGDNRSWCQALIVLGRVGAPSGDGIPLEGGSLASSTSLLVAVKVGAIASVIVAATWFGISSTMETGQQSSGTDPFVVEPLGGQLSPVESRPGGSGLGSVSRREQFSNPGPTVPSPAEEISKAKPIASLLVHVVDDAFFGSTEGRHVVVVDGEKRSHLAVVDGEGWAEFFGVSGARHLYVSRPGGFAHGERIAGKGNKIRIHLTKGRDLRGLVVVGDQPAGAGIELTLLSDAPMFGGRDWDDELTAEIFDKLGADVRARTTTDARGSFRFGGVGSGWKGVLYIPTKYRLAPVHPPADHFLGGGVIRFEGGVEDFRLFLVQRPCITGRVLETDGSRSAAGARVFAVGVDAHGDRVHLETTAGDNGDFNLSLDVDDVAELYLEYSAADGHGGSRIALEAGASEIGLDLGELLLSQSEGCVVTVVDESGLAIQGAVVAGGEFGPFSLPSNVEGLTQAYLAAGGDGLLEVVAEGYGASRAVWPESIEDGVVVRLHAASSLLVELELPGRTRHQGLSLLLESAGKPVRMPLRGRPAGGPGGLALPFEEFPRMEVEDLVPGQPLTLSILTLTGERLITRHLDGLDRGERRLVSVGLSMDSRRVNFTVQHSAGGRLKGADLLFYVDGDLILRSTSDRKGSFRGDFLPLEGLSLEIRMRGYCSRRFGNSELPGTISRENVFLEKARDVTVSLVAADGEVLRPDSVIATHAGSSRKWEGRPKPDGRFLLMDVPLEQLGITVMIGQRRITAKLNGEARAIVLQ